ncbi:MAG: hypothetical protein OXC07_08055 [Kistimonas sp.]|nr:hypothetical protein [Kistimonas sp.]
MSTSPIAAGVTAVTAGAKMVAQKQEQQKKPPPAKRYVSPKIFFSKKAPKEKMTERARARCGTQSESFAHRLPWTMPVRLSQGLVHTSGIK